MRSLKHFTLSLSILFATILCAATPETDNKDLAVFYSVPGDIQAKYDEIVEKKLKKLGFNLTDPHRRVNDQYKSKWGSTVLDLLSFMPVVKDQVIMPLLNIDPRIAGFAPFNMLIYKKLDEETTHVGHLTPKTMLDILDIKDPEVRSKFTATFKELDETLEKELGVKKTIQPYAKLPQQTMMTYEYSFEEPDDMDEFLEEFQNSFELAFINKEYLIAGYHNFMEQDNAEEILKDYDAFWTYSLCHLEFSYGMFDNAGARPDAGLFAPCTMYVYSKKGSNKLVLGMYRLHNWSDSLDIQDPTRLQLVEKLDTQIPQILTDFGMKAMQNTNPPTPLATPVVSKTSTNVKEVAEEDCIEIYPITVNKAPNAPDAPNAPNAPDAPLAPKAKKAPCVPILPKVPEPLHLNRYDVGDRSIKFSKRVPPNYVAHRFDLLKKKRAAQGLKIGEVNRGRVSAYLRGDYLSVEDVKEKLKEGGFEIIATVPVDKKKTMFSVVFTAPELIAIASKKNRGFVATLRVLVDTKKKNISITNPVYMSKGFLQADYDDNLAKTLLTKITTRFSGLRNSKDLLKFQLLPNYQFMNGMPKYKDMVEVASGDDLLERIKNNNKILFTKTLNNGSTLVGIKLGKRTNKFTKRIGRNNAAMLPYPVLIEDNKAIMLDPKYYIAYMYPLLKMSQFMTIATIPDAMIKDAERVFRKR